MDASQIWQAIQPHLAPIWAVIAAFAIGLVGLGVIAVRSLGRRIEQNDKKKDVELEKSQVEVDKAEMEVEREKLYLKVANTTHDKVEKLEAANVLKDEQIRKLIERGQEHEDSLIILRGQRDEQDKELARLNEQVKELKGEVSKLQSENKRLTEALKNAEDALKRAEDGRDIAEKAHNLERDRLNNQLTQLQSRMGEAESMIQGKEDKGINPQ